MEKITSLKDQRLVDAVLLWTGYGRYTTPRRDDAPLVNYFGDAAAGLLSTIETLENDFYASDAKAVAADLPEMEQLSIEQFESKHPDVAREIAKAFAWCYTFDFK